MIKIAGARGFTTAEFQKLQLGVEEANKRMASDLFASMVIGHKKLDGTPGFENTLDDGKTVLAHIRAQDIPVYFSIYNESFWQRLKRRASGVMVDGYEDEDGVHINRTFFTQATLAEVADNAAHESMHEIGYVHDFSITPEREYSVPYGVGDIVGQLAQSQP